MKKVINIKLAHPIIEGGYSLSFINKSILIRDLSSKSINKKIIMVLDRYNTTIDRKGNLIILDDGKTTVNMLFSINEKNNTDNVSLPFILCNTFIRLAIHIGYNNISNFEYTGNISKLCMNSTLKPDHIKSIEHVFDFGKPEYNTGMYKAFPKCIEFGNHKIIPIIKYSPEYLFINSDIIFLKNSVDYSNNNEQKLAGFTRSKLSEVYGIELVYENIFSIYTLLRLKFLLEDGVRKNLKGVHKLDKPFNEVMTVDFDNKKSVRFLYEMLGILFNLSKTTNCIIF